jgi:hypothetical protein
MIGTGIQCSPLISRALSDETYFGDGSPLWENAPHARPVIKARLRAAKRLRRLTDAYPEAAPLADVLARCKRRRRCMSGACPECCRAVQRWFVEQAQTLADATSYPLISISLAFAEQRVPQGKLPSLDTAPIKKALSYTLDKSEGFDWVVGGIDLSLNDDSQKGYGIVWQPQLYAFAAVADSKSVTDSLRKRYPRSIEVPRPVQHKECDGSTEAFSYGLKSVFVRRIAYKDLQSRWNTRKVFLPPKCDVQAMCWMHTRGFAGRLFLKGVRMTRVGDSVGLIRIRKRE